MDPRTVYLMLAFVSTAIGTITNENIKEGTDDGKDLENRDGKLFNVFTVVRFPNDPCVGTSSRNGTCYTESECSNKGGANSGACAQGFGVCCVFIATCGQSVAENCTYFESGGSEIGQCSLEICPCSTGICQMRLDFSSFVITGPSQATQTQGLETNGVASGAGIAFSYQTQCLTDSFSVTGQNTGQNAPPTICGTNDNEHMYADMDENNCNSLDFMLGSTAIYNTIPTRKWSIKITQIDCFSNLRAPQGCTQWYYGQTTDTVQTYNYNAGAGIHLAHQQQNICVRKERGYCQICWTTESVFDFDVSGKSTAQEGGLGGKTGDKCCSYNIDGMTTRGYDCVVIPGAKKSTASISFPANYIQANRFCGNSKGLTCTGGMGGNACTVCTKTEPFNIQFMSDGFENANEALADTTASANLGSGFKLAYFQTNNGC